VGTNTSTISSTFYGNFQAGFGDIYLQPFGSTYDTSYFLKCVSETGKAQWGALPDTYDLLTVSTQLNANNIIGRSISLQYSDNQVASIGIQNCNIFQGLNDIYLHFDNNALSGEMIFAVKDGNNQQQIPMSLNSGGVQISAGKAIAFGDNTLQTSAYTGAKSLAGSYTYSNITIDTQGKITAISSNSSTSVPSTISSAITFTGGATFSDSTTLFNSSSTFNSAINAYSTLNVVGKLSFNSFDANNILRSVNSTSSGFSFQQYLDRTTGNVFAGNTIGQWDQNLKNYNDQVWYYAYNTPLIVGKLNIPANYNNRIQINIPLQLTNQWCFKGNRDVNDPGGNVCEVNIEQIQVRLLLEGNEYTSFVYQNTTAHTTNDLGYQSVKFERGSGGPDNDANVMTQIFTVCNPSIQFALPKEQQNREYNVEVTYYWSFKYNSYGGEENHALNHWGNDQPSHYFTPWYVTLNQSSSSSWSSYAYNYYNNPPTYSTSFNNQYTNFKWRRPFYPEQNSFHWGTYYGTLPWGQTSLLSVDQIYTETKLLCGIGHFNNLLISGDTQSTGLIQCRGYMGRPGMGTNNSNPYTSYVDMYQINALSSNNYFNHFWTGEKIETWVDYTKLLSQSPNVSDYRIKSNFANVVNVLPGLCGTSIYQFDIHFDLYNIRGKTGVIAHELQENLPEFPHLVNGGKDAVDREGKIVPQSVDYQELTIILMKGIQELKIENDQLKEQTSQLQLQVQELYSMIQSLLSPPPN
jgi:hypothetical protein